MCFPLCAFAHTLLAAHSYIHHVQLVERGLDSYWPNPAGLRFLFQNLPLFRVVEQLPLPEVCNAFPARKAAAT